MSCYFCHADHVLGFLPLIFFLLKQSKFSYFEQLRHGFSSTLKGMQLTFKHLRGAVNQRMEHDIEHEFYFTKNEGLQTLQYPYSSLPVPDQGRYRLHNEMDDCIVCDKCAKICPVNCIDIEPIKATEAFGKTSDGTPKRLYAAVFDIDMAKCCFCGLCTTVCPTECLTMTKAYDFPEFDVRDMNYHFSNLTPVQAEEKRKEAVQIKAVEKPVLSSDQVIETSVKPVFKPKIVAAPAPEATEKNESEPTSQQKPAFKPKIQVRPKTETTASPIENAQKETQEPAIEGGQPREVVNSAPSPVFKPKFKPVMKPKNQDSESVDNQSDIV